MVTGRGVDQLVVPAPDRHAPVSPSRWLAAPPSAEPTADLASSTFETLWARHRPQLDRAARRLTGDPHDAEDLVQETVFRAFRGFDAFEAGSNFPGWAQCILYHTYCSSWRRSRWPQVAVLWDDVADRGEMWLRDTVGCNHRAEPEQAVVGALLDEEIEAALASLPDDFRTVFELAHLSDHTYAEIAHAMDLPIGTVRSRLFRARERLRHQLARYAEQHGLRRPHDPEG